jgi:ribosomal protein L37AE/L43A
MTRHKCPKCGEECQREEVDIGVGIQTGPWYCTSCDWSEEGDISAFITSLEEDDL